MLSKSMIYHLIISLLNNVFKNKQMRFLGGTINFSILHFTLFFLLISQQKSNFI